MAVAFANVPQREIAWRQAEVRGYGNPNAAGELHRVAVDPQDPADGLAYLLLGEIKGSLCGRVEKWAVLRRLASPVPPVAGSPPVFVDTGTVRAVKCFLLRCIVDRVDVHGNPLHENPFNEVAVLARMNDAPLPPNVVRAFELCRDAPLAAAHAPPQLAADRCLYVVMEELRGGELWDVVNDLGPFPPAGCATLLREMLDVVAAAHERRVVVADVSLENWMQRDGDGDVCGRVVKLIDFGLSFFLDADGTPVQVDLATGQFAPMAPRPPVGKQRYMAPELAAAPPAHFGPPADVFAVGCCAVMLLTGSGLFETALVGQLDPTVAWLFFTPGSPFGAARLAALFDGWGADVPAAACAFLAGCLAWDPADRLTAAQARAHPFLNP